MEREPYEPPAGARSAFSVISGPGFAPGNRRKRLCGGWSANRLSLRPEAGPLFRNSRPGVRAWKPKIKALQGMEREPEEPPTGARSAFSSEREPEDPPAGARSAFSSEREPEEPPAGARTSNSIIPGPGFAHSSRIFPHKKPAGGHQPWLADGLKEPPASDC